MRPERAATTAARDRADLQRAEQPGPDPASTTASTAGTAAAATAATAAADGGAAPAAAPAAPAAPPARQGTFRALRIRNYRLYFTGNVICQTGTWMNRVAQDWLVLQLTNDNPVALGVAAGLQFGPTLLLSLWAGTVADRVDKRRFLRWVQVVLGLAAVALGLLAWLGVAQVWHVFVACVVVGTAATFDGPVRQSFVAELVPPQMLSNAVSLNSLGFNGARIIGPAIAGVLISLVDTGPVMTVSGLSYIAVIIGLTRIDPAALRRPPAVRRARGQTREGLRYVRTRPDLMLVMGLLFVVATFGMNFQVTLAVIARVVFHREADSYGLLSTAIAVGALLGALLSARRQHTPRQRLLVGAALAFGLIEVTLGLLDNYLLLAILLIPQGIAMLTFINSANAMVQASTTPAMRGRVMGIYTLAFLGGAPFYSPLTGVIAEHFGGGAPLVLGGAMSAVAALVIGFWLWRTTPVTFHVRIAPLPRVTVHNPEFDPDPSTVAESHLAESLAASWQRIGGGARKVARPATRQVRRAARRVGTTGRRVVRRPGRR